MKATIVAENQLAAWEEGMLPEWPLPTRQWASAIAKHGRSRAIAFFKLRQINPSPTDTITASIRMQGAPLVRPFQSIKMLAPITRGKKRGLPLRNGITLSKTGLLRFRLMNLNSPTSRE